MSQVYSFPFCTLDCRLPIIWPLVGICYQQEKVKYANLYSRLTSFLFLRHSMLLFAVAFFLYGMFFLLRQIQQIIDAVRCSIKCCQLDNWQSLYKRYVERFSFYAKHSVLEVFSRYQIFFALCFHKKETAQCQIWVFKESCTLKVLESIYLEVLELRREIV